MSKKLFRLIVIIFVILLGLGFYFLIQADKQNKSVGETIVTTTKNIFPFGGSNSSQQNTDQEGQIEGSPTESSSQQTSLKRLRQLVTVPTSGMTEVSRVNITTSVVDGKVVSISSTSYKLRYADKTTGNIFDIDPKTAVSTRITNTTIPNTHESIFTLGGEGVVYRYTNTEGEIETYSAKLGSTNQDNTRLISGVYLPKNIISLTVSPDKSTLFYIYPSGNETVGIKSDVDNKNLVQIFSSGFSEWLVSWINPRNINMTTKASGYATGYSYTLDPITKSFTKTIGNTTGLTVNTNMDGIHSLISEGGLNKLSLFLYSTTDRTSISLGLSTAPEKCVWSKKSLISYCFVPKYISGTMPDDWYQGVASWSDAVWKIDATNNLSTLEIDASLYSGTQIDAINPLLSYDETELYFINRYDDTVWVLDL